MRTHSTLLAALPRFFDLRRSQHAPDAQRAEWRRRRLAGALQAASAVPFYAASFGGQAAPEDLAALPTLKRSQIPALHDSVLAGRPEAVRLPRVHTSGSSGAPIPLLFDRPHQHGRFAARARYLWENGWRPHHRSAWLIGILPGSPDGNLVRSRLLGGARFLSHVEDFEHQADWLQRLDPAHLYSMPSNLEAVVRVLEDRGVALPSLRRIFTGGEVLEDALRERVRRVLGAEICDDYGTTEAFLAWQCPSGSYHVNDEHVHVEIVDESGAAAAPGTVGRVLFTTLENRVMPLIRYEIDDYAEAVCGPCPCGRTLSRIGRVHGRGMNLFRGAGGRLVSPWTLVEPLRELPTVHKSQIIQHDVDRFTVRFVSDQAPGEQIEAQLRERLIVLYGAPARFTFERVEDIPRTGRGKFMSAICELA